MAFDVDLILIHRQGCLPAEPVLRGIDAQGDVRLRVHLVAGVPRANDLNRWATIARARNEGKRLGTARWLMFLDDDVILEPGCVVTLVDALRRHSSFAALAADYLGESRGTHQGRASSAHVAMGATLFRREVLRLFEFRWEASKCECQCCCDDLRRLGFEIDYMPGAHARHEPALTSRHHGEIDRSTPGRVLAAFDRCHLRRFRHLFLDSLRSCGNRETVTAVVYGLRPSEERTLASQPGVEVAALPERGVVPAIRRLHDFQHIIAQWPDDTPVAYWDAGDVRFQGRLDSLWDLVRAHPDQLLAVREPIGHPENLAVSQWTQTINDASLRRSAFDLLSRNPFLNSGFAAGTGRAMLHYLREAEWLRNSSALHGSLDWGDQTALNLYCHSNPGRWFEIPEGWNYCLYQRPRRDYQLRPDGRVVSAVDAPIHVVHGNGKSFRRFDVLLIS
jgi:hypothetical protein